MSLEILPVNSDAPLPSATVMLLRDGTEGLEVFLMRRHGDSGVLGGAWVFPGGKVDAADALGPSEVLDLSADEAHARLGDPSLAPAAALALHVAALRELLEETHVLGALTNDGALVSPAQIDGVRTAVASGTGLRAAAQSMGLRLAANALRPWSRWITPDRGGVVRKRFDTRFFVAPMPAGQEARHDGHEATESRWMTPRDALKGGIAGAWTLPPPQVMTLAHLGHYDTVAQVLAQAGSHAPRTIQPHAFEEGGVTFMAYPGDPMHSDPLPAWPGLTRLAWRQDRYAPLDGLDALLPPRPA